jgi:putative nucleotidyltransferase with HDIG domain/PAS domain S-box-containing protein
MKEKTIRKPNNRKTKSSEISSFEGHVVALEENRLGQLTHLMPSGMTHHDQSGQIIHADSSAQKILGVKLGELKGRKLTDPLWNPIFESGKVVPKGGSPPETALATGEVVSDVVMGITHPEIGELRWLMITAVPIEQPGSAAVNKVICQIRDITHIPQNVNSAERQMSLMQRFWKLLMVSGPGYSKEDKVYEEIVGFLPQVLTYPEITHARIKIGEKEFTSDPFAPSDRKKTFQIHSHEIDVGQIEFHYHNGKVADAPRAAMSADEILLETLAKWLGLVSEIIHKDKEIEQLRDEALTAYDRTIEAWSAALETQDKEASGHTKRVTDLALALAKEMGFEGENLVNIRRGALLHDIGKLSIPDEIILKPGKLTEDEFQVVKQHPEFAQKWLSQIELLKPALQIPYYHHEKWDGTGYPQGLSGEEIPLVARMFSVVDVWDVLISDRPYRRALSKEESIDILISEKGNQFDPKVVDHFINVLEKMDTIQTSYEIKIRAFGQARVWIGNERVTSKDWQIYAARDLFFLLLAHPGSLTKEQIGLHMWPDISPDELEVKLKNTLYRLRRAVGKQVILLGDTGYHFNKTLEYFYDVETFESRIEAARQEPEIQQKINHYIRAVQEYDGDYLPEIDQIWATTDRERYRLMYLDSLYRLAELHHEQGELGLALRYCNQALEEDSVFEEVHRLIMIIQAEQGNRAEVIRQYKTCQASFDEKFNMQPSQQTRELYERLVKP